LHKVTQGGRRPDKTRGAIGFVLNFLWLLSFFQEKESDKYFSDYQTSIKTDEIIIEIEPNHKIQNQFQINKHKKIFY